MNVRSRQNRQPRAWKARIAIGPRISTDGIFDSHATAAAAAPTAAQCLDPLAKYFA
jgi:hypothetical protein